RRSGLIPFPRRGSVGPGGFLVGPGVGGPGQAEGRDYQPRWKRRQRDVPGNNAGSPKGAALGEEIEWAGKGHQCDPKVVVAQPAWENWTLAAVQQDGHTEYRHLKHGGGSQAHERYPSHVI